MSYHNTMSKSELSGKFNQCLNILRDNEAITGDKALRNLSYLLILKLLEPQLDAMNIKNYDYDFSEYDDISTNDKNILFNCLSFSNLAKIEENNYSRYLNYLWDIILSGHPSTNKIFLKNKFFDIKKNLTFKKLIEVLNNINFNGSDKDILGGAYEDIISDLMTGKVLGQYFTQPIIKNIMIELINPHIYEDGSIESMCDPTMGTGGFLITYINYIINKSKKENIKLDWNKIKNNCIYGKEIEIDTFQLALSNLLISSGHMFDKIDCGDSIREPIIQKFDNVLANPPFGIKGLKYEDLADIIKDDYVPIKSNNAVSLFIQVIIHILKINGKCAVVIPDGQDLFSKSNKSLIAIREYLLKTCDLHEIIYLPSGLFTNTNIKTCIFYFIKKKICLKY